MIVSKKPLTDAELNEKLHYFCHRPDTEPIVIVNGERKHAQALMFASELWFKNDVTNPAYADAFARYLRLHPREKTQDISVLADYLLAQGITLPAKKHPLAYAPSIDVQRCLENIQ